MRRLTTAGIVASALLVGAVVSPAASATASAAKSVLLGHNNKTTYTTKITDSKGTPLSLSAGKGKAPLAVNSKTKVANLNADALDGLSSGSFLRSSASSKFASAKGKTGWTAAIYPDEATCPSGSILVGGGELSPYGASLSGPDPDRSNTWETVPSLLDDGSTGLDTYALAVCYAASGKLPRSLVPEVAASTGTRVRSLAPSQELTSAQAGALRTYAALKARAKH